MKKKLFALSGVFLIVLVIAGLWATTATDINGVQQATAPMASLTSGMSMEQMVEGSQFIVIGQCTGTQSRWVERRLVTDATILIEESLKGGAGAGTQMTVELPGGADPNRRFAVAMTYAGAPQISLDEKVFLFLGPVEGANSYSVIGYSQGKFSIGNATDGEPVVTRDMNATPVPKGVGLTQGNPQVISLSEFKKLVESLLNK